MGYIIKVTKKFYDPKNVVLYVSDGLISYGLDNKEYAKKFDTLTEAKNAVKNIPRIHII